MNKKTIITILFALVAMAGQAQSPIPESIVDTYWRNEVTGDWEIGFTESCAIYDCKIWQYGNINEKNGKVVLALNDGNKTLGVTIGKQEGGKCKMSIGKQKKQTYSLITTRTLPLYPQPDQTPFIDNGFREGDSATLIGWIKDYPILKGENRKLKVYYRGFITGKNESTIEEMDSIGFFKVKVPIENTQMITVVIDEDPYIIESLMEPDDTCFVLFDGKNNKYLYMGKNARVQNELGAARFQMVFNHESDEENLSDVQMQACIEQCKDVYRINEVKVDSVLARHPTLSRKYEDVFCMINVSRMANGILQISANSHYKIPQSAIDSMLAEVRKNVRKPYSMWYEFYDFPWMYLQHAIFSTPRKHDIAEVIEWEFQLADSIFTDPVLRECAKADRVYGMLDATNQPLNKSYLEAANKIQLPAARNAILAKNAELIVLQNKPMTFTGLRPSSDVADMSDGEKILRKIIEPYKGKLILMDIWGTWCGPCKEALSHSQEEYERLKDFGLVYLYLANNSSDESWKNVIKMYDITGDNVVHYNLPDEQQKAVEQYLNVNAFPTYKLIDREGTILDADADPRNLEKLARLLERLK